MGISPIRLTGIAGLTSVSQCLPSHFCSTSRRVNRWILTIIAGYFLSVRWRSLGIRRCGESFIRIPARAIAWKWNVRSLRLAASYRSRTLFLTRAAISASAGVQRSRCGFYGEVVSATRVPTSTSAVLILSAVISMKSLSGHASVCSTLRCAFRLLTFSISAGLSNGQLAASEGLSLPILAVPGQTGSTVRTIRLRFFTGRTTASGSAM